MSAAGPLPLLPYQHEGARFLANRERAGLFDEMGVGKTAQTIGAMDKLGAQRGIVVAPAKAHKAGVWMGEHKKFATLRRKLIRGRSIDDLNLWLRGRADVLLLSYEKATAWSPRLGGDLYDFLVFDESHRLKNREAKRTRALLGPECTGQDGAAMWAAHTWFLSGTPMPNDPVDIWPFLRFAQGTDMPLAAFTKRYFKSRIGTFGARQTPRDEMLAELQQAIRAVSIRRTQKGLGLAIPAIWLTTLSIDGDTAEVTRLLREYPGLEQAVLDAIELGGLSFLDAQHVATLRRLVGEAKAPPYAGMLIEELEDNAEKVVVMGWHKRALEIIQSELTAAGIWCVRVDGSTSETSDLAAVTNFQNDPNCRVFLGNMQAAGEAITLTSAARIDMFESSWTPKDNLQALKRVHRLGQTREVRARFISLAASIDEVVSETVARKTAAIAKVEGDVAA